MSAPLRVLLIKSRSLASKVSGTTPPLGLMCLSSFLKQRRGASTRILDVKFARDPRAAVADAVRGFAPDLVGISGLTAEARLMHEAARLARQTRPGVPVIAGGPHATSDPADLLADPAFDAAVRGEGEETLLELADLVVGQGPGWADPARLAGVRGIAYRPAPGEVALTPERPTIADLDGLPWPDWDAVDLRRFWDRPSMATLGIRPYATIFTSRGCPYRCTYCHGLFGRKFRARSPESVVAEVAELFRRYGPLDLEILDDIANLDGPRLNAVFSGLLARGLHPRISFPNGIRADLLEPETVDLFCKVGAGEVSIAVETASPRLQRRIGKNLDLDRVRRSIDLLVDHGVFTRGFFMLGFPTETASEMLATIRFATRSRLHLALFFAVNPFKDTPIFADYASRGRQPRGAATADYEYFGAPFNGSEVSDAMFRFLYRSAYYRFYLDPVRAARILRDRPYWGDIPKRVSRLFCNLASFRKVDEGDARAWDPERW